MEEVQYFLLLISLILVVKFDILELFPIITLMYLNCFPTTTVRRTLKGGLSLEEQQVLETHDEHV